jgi:hypothetical protein
MTVAIAEQEDELPETEGLHRCRQPRETHLTTATMTDDERNWQEVLGLLGLL